MNSNQACSCMHWKNHDTFESNSQISTLAPERLAMMETSEATVLKSSRSSSIGKIKEFNKYICSRHYHIIPALFFWMKSSQNDLENSLDTSISIYRHFVYNTIVYRMLSASQMCKNHFKDFMKYIQEKYSSDPVFLLRIGVYSSISIISFEFLVCIYLLFSSFVPVGLIFLVCCVGSVIFLFYESVKVDGFLEGKNK